MLRATLLIAALSTLAACAGLPSQSQGYSKNHKMARYHAVQSRRAAPAPRMPASVDTQKTCAEGKTCPQKDSK